MTEQQQAWLRVYTAVLAALIQAAPSAPRHELRERASDEADSALVRSEDAR